MKLNLGAGGDIKEGYINCDIKKFEGIDKIINCNKRLPFKDNSIDEVLCYRLLMYIKDFDFFISELHRITKPTGIIKTISNFYNSQGGHQTPYRTFSLTSFDDWTNNNVIYDFNLKFKVVYSGLKYTRLGRIIPFESLRRKISLVFGEIASEVHIDLTPIKPTYYQKKGAPSEKRKL